jgi:hypothetical protein
MEQAVKVSVDDLQADHLFAFNHTLSSILSTTLAERTFAQIILAQVYQDALPESRKFYMRLLEMLAVACHDIAALVYVNTPLGLRREGQDLE